jgi:hypothetical protein
MNGGCTSGVTVLAGVQVEHEVDERARQPRALAHQHGEPRAGDLRAALEVEDAQLGPEVPVRLRLEVERGGIAHAPHFAVVVGAPADRHARMRDVGNEQQQVPALVLERLERGVLLLDLLAAGAVGVHQRGDVFAGLLPFRHFRGRRVLIALEVLHLDDEGATAFVSRPSASSRRRASMPRLTSAVRTSRGGLRTGSSITGDLYYGIGDISGRSPATSNGVPSTRTPMDDEGAWR